jgi:hypothetical protein
MANALRLDGIDAPEIDKNCLDAEGVVCAYRRMAAQDHGAVQKWRLLSLGGKGVGKAYELFVSRRKPIALLSAGTNRPGGR